MKMTTGYLNFSGIKQYPFFADWSYYSQIIAPIKILCFLIKHAFVLRFMFHTKKFGLQDCSRFSQIKSHMLYVSDLVIHRRNIR